MHGTKTHTICVIEMVNMCSETHIKQRFAVDSMYLYMWMMREEHSTMLAVGTRRSWSHFRHFEFHSMCQLNTRKSHGYGIYGMYVERAKVLLFDAFKLFN